MTGTPPRYWVFRRWCSCPYGLQKATFGDRVLATEAEARAFFFDSPTEREQADRDGVYVTAEDEIDRERWQAQHDHPDCRREPGDRDVHPFSRIVPGDSGSAESSTQ